MHRPPSQATFLIVLLLALVGCGGRTERGAAATHEGESDGMTWTVRIGSEGGFTGGGSGHLVHADGRVESWSRPTPQDPVTTQPAGRADPDALRALHRAAGDPELVKLAFQKTGNLTGFLEWREDGTVRRWSWPERARGPVLPEPLRVAVEAARAAVQSARP